MTTAKEAKEQVIHILDDAISVTISEKDRIMGLIRNGKDGVIKKITTITKEKLNPKTKELEKEDDDIVKEILHFRGEIGPVVKIDGETPGLRYAVNGGVYTTDLTDAVTFFRSRFSLNSAKTQDLAELLNAYIFNEIEKGNFEQYASSPIAVIDDVIVVNRKEKNDVAKVLQSIRDFLPHASHPTAMVSLLSFFLLAPLHNDLKRRSIKQIQAPLAMLTGKTRGGKTTLGVLFIGKGYSLDKELYFYPYNRIYTRFTLMNKLKQTNLPALFDDLPTEWIIKAKEDLKAYVQTGHFGDRGRSDQTEAQYKGARSFAITINDDFRPDDDLALSLRLLILWFTDYNSKKKDKRAFDAMFDALPDGFMFDVFQLLFEGRKIGDVLKEVEAFESVADWINYGIDLINGICKEYGIEPFPRYEMTDPVNSVSNALEIAQAFIEEWQRMESGTKDTRDWSTGETTTKVTYRSPIEGAFKVELTDGRYYIHFTPSAFKTLMGRLQLKVPFTNASNFLNNIQSNSQEVQVENEGKPRSMRIEGMPLKVYTISVNDGGVL